MPVDLDLKNLPCIETSWSDLEANPTCYPYKST